MNHSTKMNKFLTSILHRKMITCALLHMYCHVYMCITYLHLFGATYVRGWGPGYHYGSTWGVCPDLVILFLFFSPQGTYWFLSPVCHLSVTLSLHTVTVTHQFLKRRSSQHYAALLPWLLNFHKSQWYFCRKLSEGFTPQRQQQTTVYDCSRSLYYAAKCNGNIYNSRMLYSTVIKVYGSYFQCNNRCLINDFQRS